MITKSDWQAVHEEMTADDRRKLGEPPTTEEMLAYSRGSLSAQDTERVRAWLVSNPEMARALTQPFPEDDALPGDPDYVSKDEVERRLAALKNRIHGAAPRTEGRVLQFRPAWTALAAALALVFGVLFVRSELELRRVTTQPQATQNFTLMSDQQRGGNDPEPLSVKTEFVTLLATPPDVGYENYRVDITDISAVSPRHWQGPAVVNDGVLSILVPGRYLKPGRYSIVVYGVADHKEDRLDSYKLAVGR
jgi:hypothetical protein